jgi:methyl-accepting chemotaxis protein
MFTNLKLRGRIFLGFSIPVILVFGFTGLTYTIGNQVSETFKQVSREQEAIIKTDEMVLRISLMARQVRGYLLAKSAEPLREFEKQRKIYQRAVEAAEKVVDPREKEMFKQMVELGEQFDQLSRETFRLEDQGKHAEAVNYSLQRSKEFVEKYDELNEKLIAKQLEILAQYTGNANSSIQFLILAAALTAMLTLILAAGAASLIWATISRTNRIINQTVNAIVSSSTEIAVTVEQQERSAVQQAAAVNQATTTINELGTSSAQSANQAEFSAESAHKVLVLAESSTAGAKQVLALAESSTTGAKQVLALAESSAAGAKQVLSLAEGGTKTVERSLEGMSILNEKVMAIASQISQLSEQAQQIASITNLVSDVAAQTNMLALNAAVEAVHAGEHGKGFSIVASEIRKLADQSKKSAEKINSLVNHIQTAINSTVIVTDEGRKTTELGIKLSQETAEAFASVTEAINKFVLNSSSGVAEAIGNIVLKSSAGVVESINEDVLSNQQISLMAINDIVERSQQISLTAKQQAIAIQQVVEAMNSLNQGAQQTASGISQTKVGIKNLNEAAQSLNTIV